MSLNLDECYEHVLGLVESAGSLIASRNSDRKRVLEKSSNIDLLTETDQQVERLLMDGISARYPDHRFIGEEETSEGKKAELTDAPTWIIDPVDGTMNFVHSFPHSCISIALLVARTTEIAIIFNPILGQKFTARRGKGAFLNGKPIHVSGETRFAYALATTEFGTSRDEEKTAVVLENIGKLIRQIHGMRSLGSAALNMAMVALGGADFNYEFGIHAWDIAAGDLLVREAGGVCLDPAGGPLDLMSRRVLCASTQELADQVGAALTQYYPEPRD
ncbi:inositol monophosphatase 1-like [Anopheles cruzii]|uniref:inositol monophosphatase 1-like n=1 Tax=Anopheles cruzii TaxID=68878 RepID=UPI0022EC5B79|nr:inositol monophosphatase 1-like [Anopheles cruzii]XP_052872423.1 inositol monophosphatase 1-like [Anopheles cruzii]